jgi:hypothetical protein
MTPIWVAQLGRSTTYMSNDIELTLRASPKIAMPMGRPMAMTDPKARRRITTAARRPISSLTFVSGCSNEKNRSPPISIWSVLSVRASATAPFSRSRSSTPSASRTGYCTRTSATRPSAETVPAATAASGP